MSTLAALEGMPGGIQLPLLARMAGLIKTQEVGGIIGQGLPWLYIFLSGMPQPSLSGISEECDRVD